MNKPHQFDFGFESRTTSWKKARIVLLFETFGTETCFGKVPGPLAVADASRYAEFYEMDGDFAPFDIGVYSETVDGADPQRNAVARAFEAIEQDKLPIIIVKDKQKNEPPNNVAHLSVDFDDLNSGATWYEFVDKLELAITGGEVASVQLFGTDFIEPQSPQALLCAQIIIKLVGFICKASK